MTTVVSILSYGVLALNVIFLFMGGMYLVERFTNYRNKQYEQFKQMLSRRYRELSLSLAILATTGSLYLSQGLGWEPCLMCWFQRIFMYPLVLIIGTGILFDDKNVRDYALPLAMIGVPLSFYHSILQRYEQFQSAGCSLTAVSCETTYTFHFDYITIPVMAFTAFLGIAILMWRFSDKQD